MKKISRRVLSGIFITCLCAAFAVGGFAYGTYIQYSHIVLLSQGALSRDLLVAQICDEDGCDAVRKVVEDELPLQATFYSSKYKQLHKPFPINVIGIAAVAWSMRHSADDALKSPQVFQSIIRKVTAKKAGNGKKAGHH